MKKKMITITLQVPKDLHRELIELAKKQQRSLSAQIRFMLQDKGFW